MSQKISKTITYLSIMIIVIGTIFLANGLILAWTPPGSAPPSDNVPAPLTGTLGTSGQWCTTDGSVVNCTADAPSIPSLNGWSFSNNYFYDDGEQVIRATDEWLRLNQAGNFSNGIYTPGLIRADGGFQGTASYANSAGSVPLSGITHGPGYAHLGVWGQGRTADNAVLVNTAYRADHAGNADTVDGHHLDQEVQTGSASMFRAIYQNDPGTTAHQIFGDGANWLGWPGTKGIIQYTGSYVYPGRVDGGSWQGSWYLGSHGSYGLYTNTGFYAAAYYGPGCDIAELYEPSQDNEELEPGDIVVLDEEEEKKIKKSSQPYSALVVGVVSTNPNMTMGVLEDNEDHPPVALLGRVPTKVTTENGPIKIGDLIVSSSKPGYGMRCDDYEKCLGAVVGKATENLESGEGLIEVLIKGGF